MGIVARLFVVAIALFLGVGVALTVIIGGQIRHAALSDAKQSAELVVNTSVADALAGDGLRDGLSPRTIEQLDSLMFGDGAKPHLDGITIWTPFGIVAYSNLPSTIGSRAGRLSDLAGPLAGQTVVDVKRVELAAHGAAAPETIQVRAPLYRPGGTRPIAVVRIDMPYAPVRASISSHQRDAALAILGGLAVLFAVSFPIAVIAARRLRRQVHQNRVLALHDPLTQLPNRTLFYDRVAQCVRERRRTGTEAAVLLLDLDRFKDVNDSLGHRAGDTLLVEVARRLASRLRESDTLARLGGDEFAVLLPTVDGLAGATKVADGLRASLTPAFPLDGVTLTVEASIGVAMAPEHGSDPDVLLQRADIAMYTAKGARTGHAVYDPHLTNAGGRDQLALVGELRRAITAGELRLFYQPKAELATDRIRSVEALARWQHPWRGLLPPAAFVPVAEKTGLIRPMTYWVIDEALRQCREWFDQGRRLTVAVNVSQESLLDPGITPFIEAALIRHRLPAQALEIEITESALVADIAAATETLSKWHAMGISRAIDDYGTGYSSLAHLRRLPVNCIKIDRSFVSGMLVEAKNATIVRSTIELAKDLRIGVVAEGVETKEEWQALAELGCHIAQGYYLSRPVPPGELIEWLEQRETAVTPRVRVPVAG